MPGETRDASNRCRQERYTGPRLVIEPSGIDFWNESPEELVVQLTVQNLGARPSEVTRATIHAAPLGAFLPWHPLGQVEMPEIQPGEAETVRSSMRMEEIRSLGRPERVSLRRLMVAMGLIDRRSLFLRRDWPGTGLPPDPLTLVERGDVHWAGNLNVFVEDRPVERHRARSLRIHPGETNVAMFFVGSGPDSYAFHLTGDGASWDANLYSPDLESTLATDLGDDPLAQNQWVYVETMRPVLLVLRPPDGCSTGEVRVLVTKRSTGKTAVVEFGFDEGAAGPGCYTV